MEAVIEVASKHVDISPIAMEQLFGDGSFMSLYEIYVNTFRTSTQRFTELLQARLPPIQRDSEDSHASTPQRPSEDSPARAVTSNLAVVSLDAHDNARVDADCDCPVHLQPTATFTRDDSETTMDLLEAATELSSSGWETDDSDATITSTLADLIAANSPRDERAGKRASDSPEESSAKKLKTSMRWATMDWGQSLEEEGAAE